MVPSPSIVNHPTIWLRLGQVPPAYGKVGVLLTELEDRATGTDQVPLSQRLALAPIERKTIHGQTALGGAKIDGVVGLPGLLDIPRLSRNVRVSVEWHLYVVSSADHPSSFGVLWLTTQSKTTAGRGAVNNRQGRKGPRCPIARDRWGLEATNRGGQASREEFHHLLPLVGVQGIVDDVGVIRRGRAWLDPMGLR